MVLVPLPLFIIVPGTGEPGMMTICGEPGFPVTSAAPRDVVTPDGGTMLGADVGGGATTIGGAGRFPPGEVTCARAAPATATRKAIAAHTLVISHVPDIGRAEPGGALIW